LIKILICRLSMFDNMGSMGYLMGLIKSIRAYVPGAEITILGYKPRYKKFESLLGINIRKHPWNSGMPGFLGYVGAACWCFSDFCYCSFLRLIGKINKRIKTPYDQYDIVIDSNEDSLDEVHGKINVTLSLLETFLEWAVFRRPMITTPTDVRIISNPFNRWFSRYTLNRLDIIALRDKRSYERCLQLGINKPQITYTGDAAFLLEPASTERAQQILHEEHITIKRHPFIGFSPNFVEMYYIAFSNNMLREDRANKYVDLMANLLDYIVEKYQAFICFIPHVKSTDMDDRITANKIFDKVKHHESMMILKGDYLPSEIKGVISCCDLVISGRMHPCIAATSQGIPALAIAYVDKFVRIIGEIMGQEKYIVDIRNRDPKDLLPDLKSKFDLLWAERENIHRYLLKRVEPVQKQAMLYGKLIKELAETSKVKKY
jgi:polysaccharide pyruvyl transferase WcaK-like protein